MSICEDLSEFLDTLKNMRLVDDRIIYALNTTIPTQSFASQVDPTASCKDLFTQLVNSHSSRDSSLKQCLNSTITKVQSLTEQKKANPDDPKIKKLLRREQTKLREIQTQLNVEEVIRGRTLTIFNERCRTFYKPSSGEYPL